MSGLLKTAKEVRKDFARKGVSFSVWAQRHGLRPPVVYDLLSGRTQGNWGEAHKAAVLLGLKEGEIVEGTGTDGRR